MAPSDGRPPAALDPGWFSCCRTSSLLLSGSLREASYLKSTTVEHSDSKSRAILGAGVEPERPETLKHCPGSFWLRHRQEKRAALL